MVLRDIVRRLGRTRGGDGGPKGGVLQSIEHRGHDCAHRRGLTIEPVDLFVDLEALLLVGKREQLFELRVSVVEHARVALCNCGSGM